MREMGYTYYPAYQTSKQGMMNSASIVKETSKN